MSKRAISFWKMLKRSSKEAVDSSQCLGLSHLTLKFFNFNLSILYFPISGGSKVDEAIDLCVRGANSYKIAKSWNSKYKLQGECKK